MKKITNVLISLTLTLLISTSFFSCNKYEDTPGISLSSKTQRLTGDWNVKKMTLQGVTVELSAIGVDMSIQIKKEGDITMTSIQNGQSQINNGTWEWIDGKDAIILTDKIDNTTETWNITGLKNSEFNFNLTDPEQGLIKLECTK